ncbi:MAG: LapA family protein [Candidatus Omnitrophota bacterium]
MNWKLVVILILLLLLVIFTVQNYQVVNIKFLFWSFSTSRAIIIFSTLIIGVIIGWTISYIIKRKNWQ